MSRKALVGLGGLGVGMFLAAFAANAIDRPTHSRYAPPPPVYEGRSVAPAAPPTMAPYGPWEGGCFVTNSASEELHSIRHWYPECPVELSE
jgi:hypothetical protein